MRRGDEIDTGRADPDGKSSVIGLSAPPPRRTLTLFL